MSRLILVGPEESYLELLPCKSCGGGNSPIFNGVFMTISTLHAIDSRSNWDKVSRRQCWKGAGKLGIPFPTGATHDEMIRIFEAAGVAPEQVVNFVPAIVETPQGDKVVMHPETHERKYDEHKEHRRMEEMERRIQEGVEKDRAEKEALTAKANKKEIDGIKSDISELKDMFRQVLTQMATSPPEKQKAETLETMHWKKFQKMAKDIGETWTTKEPRGPIIAKLEARENVEEPS